MSENRTEKMDILEKIRYVYPELSKRHKIIADYILDNYDRVANYTATRLGELLGISESTVVRFANAMGYDGYPYLQRELKEYVRGRLTAAQRTALSVGIDPGNTVKTVMAADMHNIRSTIEQIDQSICDRVVEKLLAAKTVYVLGLRASAPIASFVGHYLQYIVDDVRVVHSGTNDIFEQLFKITPDDALMVISFPRYSTRAQEGLQFAKERGAYTVSVTDSRNSPVSIADDCLYAFTDIPSFVDSFVAPLALINGLIITAGMQRLGRVTKTFDELETVWDRYNVYTESKRHSHDEEI